MLTTFVQFSLRKQFSANKKKSPKSNNPNEQVNVAWGERANYTSHDNCSVATNDFVTDCILQEEKLPQKVM